jgi:hypothetical protein
MEVITAAAVAVVLDNSDKIDRLPAESVVVLAATVSHQASQALQ